MNKTMAIRIQYFQTFVTPIVRNTIDQNLLVVYGSHLARIYNNQIINYIFYFFLNVNPIFTHSNFSYRLQPYLPSNLDNIASRVFIMS